MNSHVSRWNLIFSVLLRNSTQNAMQAYVPRYGRPTSTHYCRCLTALGLQGKVSAAVSNKIHSDWWAGQLGSQNQNRKSRNTGASFRFLRASTWSVNLHLSWESPCWATLWPCVKMHLCCLTELFHLQYVPFVLFSIYRFWNLIQRPATSPKTCNGRATTSKIYLCVFDVCIGLFQAFGSNF